MAAHLPVAPAVDPYIGASGLYHTVTYEGSETEINGNGFGLGAFAGLRLIFGGVGFFFEYSYGYQSLYNLGLMFGI